MLKSPIMMFEGGVSSFSVLVSISFQNLAFSCGALGAYMASKCITLFSGQFSVKLTALHSLIVLGFDGVQFILFLLVTITMPFDLGFNVSYKCKKWRLGEYCEFRFLICLLSKCDSKMLSTAIFFDSMVLIMVFHLSLVAMLFAPLTFRAANMIEPAEVGFGGYLPLSL